ncbi:unnamed protein product [marine sediment metagenome]|uniref:Uncharacterized protein n=1 Tax=marine sediment metagenome TaxID=412755 RepID=X1A2M5_9ZZZZ
MYYTGIDLHKFTSYLTTVDSSGNIVKQQNVKNVDHNFVQYFGSIPGKHQTTVESTMTWYWLNDLLSSISRYLDNQMLPPSVVVYISLNQPLDESPTAKPLFGSLK